jgi:hypothetical protein
LRIFDEQAGLGSEAAINQFRSQLINELQVEWARFNRVNSLRNPYREIEPYILPVCLAAAAWLVATLFDQWCTSDQCEFIEDTFERIYIFAGICILAFAYR